MATISLTADVAVDRVRAYLTDPANRPQWQSSLRAIADLRPGRDGPTGAGTSWTDITVVPGLRPRLETTESTPNRWSEVGAFGPIGARLTLVFTALPATGAQRCRIDADFEITGVPVLARACTPLARPAIAADLRRAVAILA